MAIEVLEEQKKRRTCESTSGVPAKDLPNVKLVIEESPITRKCKSLEISHTLEKMRLGAYIVV